MRVSYQNANLRGGNESTLLRFTEDGTRACILVDAGDGVNLDDSLENDEYLNAILLTHAHIDHYRSLGTNLRHNAPIYVSPATAAVLEQSLPEARKDNDLGDVDAVLEALEPIENWTEILDWLAVRPVPTGHAPGASGFLIRFRDGTDATDGALPATERHILVTGDFTTRPCAGFPPLPDTYPVDIDAIFLNASTNESVVETLTESVETILERAYGGSRVVAASSSLTGVHYAVLLARIAASLERPLPVTVVGQTARVYEALGLDVPGVETHEVFDDPATVVEQGCVTVAGPDTPTHGSAKRLLLELHDDPGAVFVQLATGNADAVSNARCTTHYFEAHNHPPLEAIDDFVRGLAPTEVIIKHARGYTLNEFQRRYDSCFTWGTDDEQVHHLYDGEWLAPGWLGEATVRQIRQKQWSASQDRTIDPTISLALEQQSVDPADEGVDLETIEAMCSASVANPYEESTTAAKTDESESVVGGTDGDTVTDPSTVSTLDEPGTPVRARVLGDGDGETLLYLLERTELSPGELVDVSISSLDDGNDGGDDTDNGDDAGN